MTAHPTADLHQPPARAVRADALKPVSPINDRREHEFQLILRGIGFNLGLEGLPSRLYFLCLKRGLKAYMQPHSQSCYTQSAHPF